jgi:hypothetical protein
MLQMAPARVVKGTKYVANYMKQVATCTCAKFNKNQQLNPTHMHIYCKLHVAALTFGPTLLQIMPHIRCKRRHKCCKRRQQGLQIAWNMLQIIWKRLQLALVRTLTIRKHSTHCMHIYWNIAQRSFGVCPNAATNYATHTLQMAPTNVANGAIKGCK